MSGGNEFFTAAKGSLEQAMAFWPEPREKSAGAEAAELIQQAEHNFGVDISARAECLGRITCVEGAHFILCLDSQTAKMDAGFSLKRSALVKVAGEQSVIYGVVTALTVPAPAHSEISDEVELAEVELIGEAVSIGDRAFFRKGVGDVPTLGDLVYLATGDDIALIEQGVEQGPLIMGEVMGTMPRPAKLGAEPFLSSNTLICGKDVDGLNNVVRVLARQAQMARPEASVAILDSRGHFKDVGEDAEWLIPLKRAACPFWELPSEVLTLMACGEFAPEQLVSRVQPFVEQALRQQWTPSCRDNHKVFLETLYSLTGDEADMSHIITAFEAMVEDEALHVFFEDGCVPLRERLSSRHALVFDASNLAVSALRYFTLAFLSQVTRKKEGPWADYVFIDDIDCLFNTAPPLLKTMMLGKIAEFLRHQRVVGGGSSFICQNIDLLPDGVEQQIDGVIAFRMSSPAMIERLKQFDVDKRGALLDMLPILDSGQALVFGDLVPLAERCWVGKPESN